MALKVAITHKTHYNYDRKVNLSPHIIRLRPAPHSRTPIESYSLNIEPKEHFINWQQDPYGNYLARVVFPEKTDKLHIDVELVANMVTINPFDFFVEDYAKDFPFKYPKAVKKELKPYLKKEEKTPNLKKFLKTIDKSEKSIIDFLVELNAKIHDHLDYTIRLEPGVQTCEYTLGKKLGSCRDYAWLFVQVLRHLGLAARFVSGYLVQLTADVESLDGPNGPEADFTDLHAWTEVYIPGAGWIGLDATSGLFAGEGHIPLACTPHYDTAHAIEGGSDKCEVEFEYENSVKRIFESPRVTKPYRKEQWEAIHELGFKVDEDLEANDVRLSMGGEPTFVSIDDMESDQWNNAADGEHKRELANIYSRKLLKSFTNDGGLLHHAQGKWYPGEPLPRWQVTIYWRKDGKPVWEDPSLLGDMNETYDYTEKDAKNFLAHLAKTLGVSDQNIVPAYEDPVYYIMKEASMPLDVDVMKYDLKDSLERKTIAQKLAHGLNNEVGYVLPLNFGKTKWITSKWEFNRGNLFLTPGNAPLGLRLPLESLLHKPHVEVEETFEPDLFATAPALGDYITPVKKRAKKKKSKVAKNNTYLEYVKTAIGTEIRDGKLCIFLPPINSTEMFLDLIASIEETAKTLDFKVILEGYEPPEDNRTERIKVTPDPGVIEVNIHPSSSWDELNHNIDTLYEDARLSRLGTEKFMVDGRHTGTGGGNHVTIGAMHPSDSSLLRDPRLLQSLITFWQHHPGLSYLFSGAFIGPTSQAPRVDEGRVENLYELEIAFSQIPEDGQVPYWLTDRLFRNLLTDLTGNTHRSEFCIDKLYSPDSSSGRLGILELRGFDMPPHKEMALLQMLLVRALVSAFWKKPYQHKLIRWGTRLHDQFLLEHYVKEDIRSVVEYLNDAGYAFELDWFDPFFEFRFPLYGMTKIEGMDFEIRSAIEPWHVLGEESSSQGTSRYVDSSVERLQIKVNNFIPDRYIVTCNGVEIPMEETHTHGEYVCGVRYKAWQPWSALHPTIGVDTPLTFDVIDTWNLRSLGGFNYFVSHPGGRSYDTFPVNSYEAESRRINRYWDFNNSQGDVEFVKHAPLNQEISIVKTSKNEVKELSIEEKAPREIQEIKGKSKLQVYRLPKNKEYPHTLDMRQRWIK